MSNDNLGERMKKYEFVTRTHLMRRTPVIIRVDGKAFHTFTKGFKRPFDDVLIKSMQDTMKYLCENIQGCVLGYTQSDEITLVLTDYANLNTAAWFDYNIQKCASVAASMATMAFNKAFANNITAYWGRQVGKKTNGSPDTEYLSKILDARQKGAMFDARVFNLPREEVCNCLLWRQLDASRNSIQMVAQSEFSHKQLQNKTCDQLQEMLFQERGINWNDYQTHYKRGSCCVKRRDENGRNKWIIDLNIPKFVDAGRAYVDNLIL